MVDPRVVAYIQTELKAGYTGNAIRSQLLQQGYSELQIRDAFNLVYQHKNIDRPLPKKHSFPLIGLLALIVVLIGVLSFSYLQLDATEQDIVEKYTNIHLETYLDSFTYDPGDTMEITRVVKNHGDTSGFDVELEYRITKSESQSVVATKKEQFTFTGDSRQTIEITLPQAEGTYLLQTTMKYAGVEEKQEKTLSISSQVSQSCFDGILNQNEIDIDCGGTCEPCSLECPRSCDDYAKCTLDFCAKETEYQCVHEDIIPCCGNGICEEGESCDQDCLGFAFSGITKEKDAFLDEFPEAIAITDRIETIKEISKNDLDRALFFCGEIALSNSRETCYLEIAELHANPELCEELEETRNKDKCFAKIAKDKSDAQICAAIESDTRRDSCYMGFALAGQYEICPLITNAYLKDSCTKIESIQNQAAQHNVGESV